MIETETVPKCRRCGIYPNVVIEKNPPPHDVDAFGNALPVHVHVVCECDPKHQFHMIHFIGTLAKAIGVYAEWNEAN